MPALSGAITPTIPGSFTAKDDIDEPQAVSGITRGLSVAAGGRYRPTIGLLNFGSMAPRGVDARRVGELRVTTQPSPRTRSGTAGRGAGMAAPWAPPAGRLVREGSEFA
jgi:hypothetical protein